MKKLFTIKGILAAVAVIFALSLVSCKDDKQSEFRVKSVTMNPTSKNLYIGESFQLEAIVSPATAKDKTLTWSSSNDNVTVNQSGKITAVKEGKSIITATANDGSGAKAACEVTVKAKAGDGGNGGSEDGNGDGDGNGNEGNVIKVSSVTMEPTTKELSVGDSYQLEATVSPTNATDKTLTWLSSSEKVKVSSSGRIIAVKAGTATITATANDGSGAKAKCEVMVKNSTNYKTVYTESDYYLWDAYEPHGKNDTGKWEEGSSYYHEGTGVRKAEQSSMFSPTYDEICMYLGAGVYWVTDGPEYKLPDGTTSKAGLWVKKSSKINGFSNGSAHKEHFVGPQESNKLFIVGKPSNTSDYFFLPAAGCYWYNLPGVDFDCQQNGFYSGSGAYNNASDGLMFGDDGAKAVNNMGIKTYYVLRLFAE